MTYPSTLYPTRKDTAVFMEVIDGSTRMNSSLFSKFSGTILAIENELGIKPSGVYSDVRQRLDAMEAGINTLISYGAAHSTTIATRFAFDWISPEIVLPDFSTYLLPSVMGKLPMNPRSEAGFPDGYGYVYFTSRFYVDADIDEFTFSLWEVSSTPTEIVSRTFGPGEHTYSVLLSISLTNVDYLYEIRGTQTTLLPVPTYINSLLWNSRFIFIASGDFGGIVPVPLYKYIACDFNWEDVYDGYKLIGDIETQGMVQSASLIITEAFDGATQITVGDAYDYTIIMNSTQNIPSVIDVYRTHCDVEYTMHTAIYISFPSGTPTVGEGTVVVYYH